MFHLLVVTYLGGYLQRPAVILHGLIQAAFPSEDISYIVAYGGNAAFVTQLFVDAEGFVKGLQRFRVFALDVKVAKGILS
jgi:hypothetical protein